LFSDKVDPKEYANLEKSSKGSGAKLNIILPKNNSWGAVSNGLLPDVLPGSKKAGVKGHSTGASLKLAAEGGSVNAFYIVGSDPVKSFSNPELATKALDAAAFVVVQDLFLTETAKLADVVLPACSFAEKTGHFTNIEGRVQKFDATMPPAGDSLPDGEIFIAILKKLGHADGLRLVSDVVAF
jgi:predicted molibdopterin-dependent oxidoreductase YjgC